MSTIDLTPVARPANAEPWKRKDPRQVRAVIAASTLPAVIAFAIGAMLGLDATIVMLLIFVPLQAIAPW